MLDFVMGIDEVAELWDMPSQEIEELCVRRLIVSKKIDGTWVVFRDQDPSWLGTKEDAQKFAKEIEWDLTPSRVRRVILDENTRKFYQKVNLMRYLRAKELNEPVIRELFHDLSDDEYKEINEVSKQPDNL